MNTFENLLPWTGDGPCLSQSKPKRPAGRLEPRATDYQGRKLSERQKQIVSLYGDGLRVCQIARHLGIGDSAVEQALHFACNKLLLHDKKQLKQFAQMFPDLLRIEAERADDAIGSADGTAGDSSVKRGMGRSGAAIETAQTLARWFADENRSNE